MVACACLRPGAARAALTQALGPSFETSLLRIEGGSRYTFEAPGLTYALRVGERWAFAAALSCALPLAAAQDGVSAPLGDFYTFAFDLELSVGAQRWFQLSPSLELGVGPRVHAGYLALQARPAYRTFRSALLGAGLAGELTYATRARLLGTVVVLNAFMQGTVDPLDALHGDRLQYGLSLLAGLGVGLRF